jgi:predicted phage tail protein
VVARVEIPCLGKNVIAASNAMSCEHGVTGFDAMILSDEVVDAVRVAETAAAGTSVHLAGVNDLTALRLSVLAARQTDDVVGRVGHAPVDCAAQGNL